MRSTSKGTETLVALMAPLLLVAVASCDDAEDDGGASAGGSSSSNPSSAGPESEPASTESAEAPDSDPSDVPVELDHTSALAAGLSGNSAVVCGYTYSAEELRQIQMISPSDEIDPEATVYLHGPTIFWEIPQPDGRISHVLGLDQMVYAWKIPGTTGVQSEDLTSADDSEFMAQLQNNAHDCQVYGGPMSIFEVPSDITFQSVGAMDGM